MLWLPVCRQNRTLYGLKIVFFFMCSAIFSYFRDILYIHMSHFITGSRMFGGFRAAKTRKFDAFLCHNITHILAWRCSISVCIPSQHVIAADASLLIECYISRGEGLCHTVYVCVWFVYAGIFVVYVLRKTCCYPL